MIKHTARLTAIFIALFIPAICHAQPEPLAVEVTTPDGEVTTPDDALTAEEARLASFCQDFADAVVDHIGECETMASSLGALIKRDRDFLHGRVGHAATHYPGADRRCRELLTGAEVSAGMQACVQGTPAMLQVMTDFARLAQASASSTPPGKATEETPPSVTTPPELDTLEGDERRIAQFCEDFSGAVSGHVGRCEEMGVRLASLMQRDREFLVGKMGEDKKTIFPGAFTTCQQRFEAPSFGTALKGCFEDRVVSSVIRELSSLR